ncbi:uncharacterized protein [Henckelia pumila]|uniref:uncharacterized protein n=1 Tax=Henckelia pumila TaxID=405737 RepID=UPI003C6DBA92
MASTGLRQLALQFGISDVRENRNSRTRGSLLGSNLRSVSMNLRTRNIFLESNLRSVSVKQNCWSANIPDRFRKRDYELLCKGSCSRNSGSSVDTGFIVTTLNLARSVESWRGTIFLVRVASTSSFS